MAGRKLSVAGVTAGMRIEVEVMKGQKIAEASLHTWLASGPDPQSSQWISSTLWSAQQGSNTDPWFLPSEQLSAAPVLHLMAALLDCPLSHLPNQGLRKGVHTTDMPFSQHLCPGLLPLLPGHQDRASSSNPHSGQILALRNLANASSPPAASLTSLMVRIHRGLLSYLPLYPQGGEQGVLFLPSSHLW